MFKRLLAACALLCLSAVAHGQTQSVSKGIYQAAPPTLADGQTGIMQTDQNGNLKVFNIDNYAITQTIVSVTATSSQMIAANSLRRYLAWMVVGGADVTCAPGASAVVAGSGMVYQNSGSGHQGSSQEFPHGAPNIAFQCITASGTSTLTVWEGM